MFEKNILKTVFELSQRKQHETPGNMSSGVLKLHLSPNSL